VELRYYLGLLRRWWWLLLLAIVVFAGPAYYLTSLQPNEYRASTTIFVNQTAAAGQVTYSDALLNQQLVKTYSRMAEQQVVLEEVTQKLPIPYTASELAAMVSAQPIRDTQLFEVSVTGRNPIMITDIANVTAETFIEQQRANLPGEQSSALSVAQPALEPSTPIAPNPGRNAILAGILGLLLAGGLVMLLEYLDDTIKTPENLQATTGLATLGGVPRLAGKQSNGGLLLNDAMRARSSAGEAYRVVRTNLEFASIDHEVKSILVTSSSAGEGKSTTAANLAIVQAQAGKQVILVDADLRKPALHRMLGISNRQGLTSALMSESVDLNGTLQPSSVPGLRVMTSGPIPPNPAELLGATRFSDLLQHLESMADLVIIDSPPTSAVTDPIVLSSRVDGVLMVVDSGRTRSGTVQQTVGSLAKSGTPLLGGVLNKMTKRSGEYYYYYTYGYGQDGSDGDSGGTTTPQPRGAMAPLARWQGLLDRLTPRG